ncbi:MAG: divalent metal cation transporter, partial [bacterium]|nr:divalent metal cation transporter [bacterium]
MISSVGQGRRRAESLWRTLAAGGPGLVFLVANIGPRDLLSGSVAGSNFGYSLIWTLLLIGVARYVIVEATARYVIATGESLLNGVRRIGSCAAWLILGAIVFKRHLSNLYHALLRGLSATLLFGLDGPAATGWASLSSVALAFSVMYTGGYSAVEKWSKPLVVLLAAPLLITAIWFGPKPGELIEGIFVPAMPDADGPYGPSLAILLLIASGVESVSNLKYSAYIYEKGWRNPSHLRQQRIDLLVSVVGAIFVSAMVQ